MTEEAMRLLPERMPEVEETQVALASLPPNDRLIGPEPTKDLIDWIRAVGLVYPLTLWENGGNALHVHDGRRRIKALRILSAEWRKRQETPEGVEEATNPFEYVDAKIVSTDGFENHQLLTIILNSTAKPNPVTELEAIEGLVRQGAGVDDIAKATGLRKSTVEARLKLIDLKPKLREALTAGKISPSNAERAAKLPEKAQARLVSLYEENGKVTGHDVDEQRQARTQAAAATAPISGIPDLSDLAEEEPDEPGLGPAKTQDAAPSPEVAEATSHLTERVMAVMQAKGNTRIKWTKKDALEVQVLIDEYLEREHA